MSEQIAVLSPGVWQLKSQIEALTGHEPVRWRSVLPKPKFGCVVGWGLKSTSREAQKLAKRTDKNYIAMEDGFLRSIYPGDGEIPVSLVMDRTGIYYDSRNPTDMEAIIEACADHITEDEISRVRHAIDFIKQHAISKYNHSPYLSEEELGLERKPTNKRVLVVDQTFKDSSIEYGLANAHSFDEMFETAVAENPECEILIKTHPEVVLGQKKGYLTHKSGKNVKLITKDVNPWSLINLVDKVYVVTSQMGLEALLADRDVTCFGAPFYSGWGLTNDKKSIERRKARPTKEQLFAAVYLKYAHYFCPEKMSKISLEEALQFLLKRRETFFSKYH